MNEEQVKVIIYDWTGSQKHRNIIENKGYRLAVSGDEPIQMDTEELTKLMWDLFNDHNIGVMLWKNRDGETMLCLDSRPKGFRPFTQR